MDHPYFKLRQTDHFLSAVFHFFPQAWPKTYAAWATCARLLIPRSVQVCCRCGNTSATRVCGTAWIDDSDGKKCRKCENEHNVRKFWEIFTTYSARNGANNCFTSKWWSHQILWGDSKVLIHVKPWAPKASEMLSAKRQCLESTEFSGERVPSILPQGEHPTVFCNVKRFPETWRR